MNNQTTIEQPSKYSNAPLRKDVEIINVQVFYDIEVTYKIAGAEDFMLLESSMDLADEGGPASKAAAQFIRRWPHEKIVALITGHEEDEAAEPTVTRELTEFDKELLARARALWTDEEEAELLEVSQQGPSELDVDIYLAAHDLKANNRSLCTGHPREDATFQNLLSELAAAVEAAPYDSRQRIKAQELLLLTLRAGPQNKE